MSVTIFEQFFSQSSYNARINSPHDISIHSIFQRRSISFGFYASFLQAQKYVTVFDRLYFCIRKLFIFLNYCWKIPNTLSHQMHFIVIVQKAFYQIDCWRIQHNIFINKNSYRIFFLIKHHNISHLL